MGPTLRLTPLSPACGFRRTLYAWRLDPGPTGPCGQLKVGSLSPGARAGAGSVRGRANREDLSLPPGGSEAGPVGLGLERSSLARRCCELLGTRPAIPACPTLRPCGFNGLKLRAAEAGPISSLHRAASRRRIEAVPKSLLPRRPFGLCLGRANPRLDVWKVRLAADSGKRGTVQLSTFRQNASGQEWITQRPGALAKIRSDPAAPVGAAGGH